ncbi:FeS assembly ATPase SufC [Candidatus Hodgkinia cicadicola]|uniref:FeS assembly ATPase SufC n=1 Tax=Candidatus Hodgkinia cicadicola TaxID=573658 RepID=A0ABX4MHS6_9HYPH|nr:FeS assembly ATPase SufC [Candidatus Hodgkinia cicadicola]
MIRVKGINLNLKGKRLLSDINFRLFPGELCVLFGKNGIGKTSFISALSNIDGSELKKQIDSNPNQIKKWWKKNKSIVFVGFQHPIEIPGVIYIHYLRLVSKRNNKDKTLLNKLQELDKLLDVKKNMLYRPMNIGFSGGEKRMFELFQMIIIEPNICLLDEPDSGLDDIKTIIIARIILGFNISNRTYLIVTHNPRLLLQLSPDSVYYLIDNRIISFRKKLYISDWNK